MTAPTDNLPNRDWVAERWRRACASGLDRPEHAHSRSRRNRLGSGRGARSGERVWGNAGSRLPFHPVPIAKLRTVVSPNGDLLIVYVEETPPGLVTDVRAMNYVRVHVWTTGGLTSSCRLLLMLVFNACEPVVLLHSW